MKNLRKWGATLSAGVVILGLAGCADRNNNGQAESPATGNEVGNAVADNLGDTANAVKNVGNGIANGAGAVANTVSNGVGAMSNGASNAAGKMANTGANGAMSLKIKTALGANAGLKGSKINVNTMTDKKMVSLQGSVKTASQKKMAGAVATKNAPGYKISNMLKVGAM